MNTKLIIVLTLGILTLSIVFGILWYVFSPPGTSQTTIGEPVTLPTSGGITVPTQNPSTATSSQVANQISIKSQTGGTIAVNDFIHNGLTILDKANPGNYLLAGNLGYCFNKPSECQAAPAPNFYVYFYGASQTFVIALIKEPIGQARLDMEQFMAEELGISETQMCSLNYYVGVTRYINDQYAGRNLGFSFCPGATALPQ